MLRRWLALTYYLYALWLTALHYFYFNPLYIAFAWQMTNKRTGKRKTT